MATESSLLKGAGCLFGNLRKNILINIKVDYILFLAKLVLLKDCVPKHLIKSGFVFFFFTHNSPRHPPQKNLSLTLYPKVAHLEWLFRGLQGAYLSVSFSVYGLWVYILKACRARKALPGFKYLGVFITIFITMVSQNIFLAGVPGTAACHASNHRGPSCKITLCISSNRELLQKRNSAEQGWSVCMWHRLCCLQGVCSKLV